jgi:hypothetical protein
MHDKLDPCGVHQGCPQACPQVVHPGEQVGALCGHTSSIQRKQQAAGQDVTDDSQLPRASKKHGMQCWVWSPSTK